MSLIKELRQDIKTNKPVTTDTNSQNGNNQQGRRNVNKCCWSHGTCAHSGFECTAPREGHKNSAAFTNKMSGSTA